MLPKSKMVTLRPAGMLFLAFVFMAGCSAVRDDSSPAVFLAPAIPAPNWVEYQDGRGIVQNLSYRDEAKIETTHGEAVDGFVLAESLLPGRREFHFAQEPVRFESYVFFDCVDEPSCLPKYMEFFGECAFPRHLQRLDMVLWLPMVLAGREWRDGTQSSLFGVPWNVSVHRDAGRTSLSLSGTMEAYAPNGTLGPRPWAFTLDYEEGIPYPVRVGPHNLTSWSVRPGGPLIAADSESCGPRHETEETPLIDWLHSGGATGGLPQVVTTATDAIEGSPQFRTYRMEAANPQWFVFTLQPASPVPGGGKAWQFTVEYSTVDQRGFFGRATVRQLPTGPPLATIDEAVATPGRIPAPNATWPVTVPSLSRVLDTLNLVPPGEIRELTLFLSPPFHLGTGCFDEPFLLEAWGQDSLMYVDLANGARRTLKEWTGWVC